VNAVLYAILSILFPPKSSLKCVTPKLKTCTSCIACINLLFLSSHPAVGARGLGHEVPPAPPELPVRAREGAGTPWPPPARSAPLPPAPCASRWARKQSSRKRCAPKGVLWPNRPKENPLFMALQKCPMRNLRLPFRWRERWPPHTAAPISPWAEGSGTH